MKYSIQTIIATGMLVVINSALAEPAPQAIIDLVNTKTVGLASSTPLVEAVKAQNAQSVTLDQIKEMDEKWQATAGVADFMTPLLQSSCAEELKRIQDAAPYYTEIFVVDNQGANVCMTNKTSDYWQGDEAKFQKSFTGGKGQVFIGDVKFDDSSQTYVVQASVPVVDGDQAVGVVVFGIDVDQVAN